MQVMNAGSAVEYDSPAELLKNKSGLFTSMVNDTGKFTSKFLQSVAVGSTKLDEHREQLVQVQSLSIAGLLCFARLPSVLHLCLCAVHLYLLQRAFSCVPNGWRDDSLCSRCNCIATHHREA